MTHKEELDNNDNHLEHSDNHDHFEHEHNIDKQLTRKELVELHNDILENNERQTISDEKTFNPLETKNPQYIPQEKSTEYETGKIANEKREEAANNLIAYGNNSFVNNIFGDISKL